VKLPLIKQCTVSGPPFGRSTQGLLRESVYYSTSRHLASSLDKTSEKPRRACYRERSSASWRGATRASGQWRSRCQTRLPSRSSPGMSAWNHLHDRHGVRPPGVLHEV